MLLPQYRADAAAIHLHLAARFVRRPDVVEIEPEGAPGGHILNETAAAVDIKAGTAHGGLPRENIHAAHCADSVGQAGGLGVLAQHRDRHIRVNGAHFLQNGLQNGVITGIAPAIGTADHYTVPLLGRAVMAAKNFPVNVKLGIHCALNGEFGGGFFIEPLTHFMPQTVIAAKCRQIGA